MNIEEVVVKEDLGLCRCCHSEGTFKELNREYVSMEATEIYAEMLHQCYNIRILHYPSCNGINVAQQLICEACIARLREAYIFRKQVIDAEKKMANMIGQPQIERVTDDIEVKMEPTSEASRETEDTPEACREATTDVQVKPESDGDIYIEEHGVTPRDKSGVTDDIEVKMEPTSEARRETEDTPEACREATPDVQVKPESDGDIYIEEHGITPRDKSVHCDEPAFEEAATSSSCKRSKNETAPRKRKKNKTGHVKNSKPTDSNRVTTFWDDSSDEDIFNDKKMKSAAISTKLISKIEQHCRSDVKNNPRSSFQSDVVFTPLIIEPAASFDDCPLSVQNITTDRVNIPTLMPSPQHCNCGIICKGEFCTGLDQSVNESNNRTTRSSRRRFGGRTTQKGNAITRNFSQSQPSATQVLAVSPLRPITPSREETGEDTDIDSDSEQTDRKINISSVDKYESDISSSRKKETYKGRNEWAHNKRKRLTNLGLEYSNKHGKIMRKKIKKSPCTCRLKCNEKVSNSQRQIIFEYFWKLGDRQKQWSYLVKYVKKVNKNRCTNRDKANNRQFTFQYYFPNTELEMQESVVRVCKVMFINTLAVSDRMIRTAWEKYDGGTQVEEDRRGRHNNHKKIITEDMIRSVMDHVNTFARVKSHSLKAKRLYSKGTPTISRMFQLYNEWFDSEKYTTKAKTQRQYNQIVRKNFN